MNVLRDGVDKKKIASEGFEFLLDYNSLRMVDMGIQSESTNQELNALSTDATSENNKEALIFLETLGNFPY